MNAMYSTIDGLCREQHITVTELCRKLGIGRSTLSELKAGRTQMLSADATSKIAHYFDVPVDFLLGKMTRTEMERRVHDERTNELAGTLREVPDAQRIVLLARRAADIPDAERARLIKLFEDTLDLYLAGKEPAGGNE